MVQSTVTVVGLFYLKFMVTCTFQSVFWLLLFRSFNQENALYVLAPFVDFIRNKKKKKKKSIKHNKKKKKQGEKPIQTKTLKPLYYAVKSSFKTTKEPQHPPEDPIPNAHQTYLLNAPLIGSEYDVDRILFMAHKDDKRSIIIAWSDSVIILYSYWDK